MGFRRVGQICSSRVDFPSEAISKALKTNSTLTSINLAWNRIGEVGVKARWVSGRCCSRVAFPREAICEALKRNSTLTSINLESNRIGVEGAKARLGFRWVRAARAGFAFLSEAIGEALKTNSTLASIILENNNIGGECGKARRCQGLAQGVWWFQRSASSSSRCLAVSLRGACRGSEQQHNSLRN